MKFKPYESIGVAKFGDSQSEVIAKLGKPDRETVNRLGQVEISYPSVTYRFRAEQGLVEVSIDAPTVELENVSILFSSLMRFMRERDVETFEKVGFTVSPKLGIAIDPEYPSWVTIFAKNQILSWNAI
jgi:hypothetical protein